MHALKELSIAKRRDTWTLLGRDGTTFESGAPGQFGGHRKTKIYGRLNCRAALNAITRGGYESHRVFFSSESDARAAGYRPCAVCMPAEYARWKPPSNSRRGK